MDDTWSPDPEESLAKQTAFPGKPGFGASKEVVKPWQEWLCLNGRSLTIDGVYGQATHKVLESLLFMLKNSAPDAGTDPHEFAWGYLVGPAKSILKPIPPPNMLPGIVASSVAGRFLACQAREVGGANRGPYVRTFTYGKDGEEWRWCIAFALFCVRVAMRYRGRDLPISWHQVFGSTALYNKAHQDKKLLDDPTPGCIFLVSDETKEGKYRHGGIVRTVAADTFTTIEGNVGDTVKTLTRSIQGKAFIDPY